VKITNVFGEYFTLDKDEVLIQFGTNKTINLDFTFVERKREINFNNGNQIFKFNTSE
jgi:cytochrome c oxidase assembly protein Cox11